MDEKYTDLAVKLENVDSRSKSNQNRLDHCEAAIKELREDQKAIIILANGVDKIANEMVNIKEDIKDVKAGQSELTEKVTILEKQTGPGDQRTLKRHDGQAFVAFDRRRGSLAALPDHTGRQLVTPVQQQLNNSINAEEICNE